MTRRLNAFRTAPATAERLHRRTVLAATASLLPAVMAGCQTGPGGSSSSSGLAAEAPTARFEMDPIADAELPAKVLYSVQASADGDSKAALLDRTLDGGATTRGTRPPLPANQHIAFDGTVVELAEEITDETPATTYSVKVDVVQDSVRADEAVQFADLPAVDRAAFAERGLESGDVVGIGTTVRYLDEERDASVLVPEPEYSYIVWENGAEAEWVVDDASETSVKSYRYSAEQVATAPAYGQQMRGRFAFALFDLSTEQRDVVETATEDDGYVVESDESPPQALLELAEQFRGQEQTRGLDEPGEGDLSGPYLVRYDGEVYWTVFVVDREAFATTTPN